MRSQKIITTLITLALTSQSALYAGCIDTTLIATAYYSPLPDQESYVMGDLESEKKLQGNGVAGASGRAVFDGMIAASSNYAFGTQIVLEGRGIGQVEDRGGAIVPAGERGYKHDRVDIWMGHGDTGRIRALLWGKRTVQAQICDPLTYDLQMLGTDTTSKSLYYGETSPGVGHVQQFLIDTGYLQREKPTGHFGDETRNALCQRQIDSDITTHDSGVCGLYGPATRAAMRSNKENLQFSSMIDTPAEKILDQDQTTIHIKKTDDLAIEDESNTPPQTISTSTIYHKGEFGYHIVDLQKTLADEGYYHGDITGLYDNQTHDALQEKSLIHTIISTSHNQSNHS